MSKEITPFRIDIPDAVLQDLQQRLNHTRWPDQIAGTGWSYGADVTYIKSLCDYWRDHYDWRKQETALNRFAQFTTVIDDHSVHFVHVRSRHESARPLLISHGWPGSVVEFIRVIEPLTDPEAHGGQAEDAFHVVCPSLPGYGFSEVTRRTQLDTLAMAEMFAELMARLGYESYIAQGGDWGAIITSNIGIVDAEHVLGIHLNMPFGLHKGADAAAELDAKEQQHLDAMARFDTLETGYQKIQGTKPQTLGVGLNDSPAGLAAWITEKFHRWTDCDGDIESVISKDILLTNIMVYWVTQTITSSMRLYYEVTQNPRLKFLEQTVDVPTGIARFPREVMRFPRQWTEEVYSNVVHWNEFERGGHFAALEQPEVLVKDIREFSHKL